jgi:hypothetical protein
MTDKTLLLSERDEEVDDLFDQIIDMRADLADKGCVPRIPGQPPDRTEAGDLVEVVAHGGKVLPGCRDGLKLVGLDGQKVVIGRLLPQR